MEYEPNLTPKTVIEAIVPSGVDLGRPLLPEEINAIYGESATNRWIPDWIVDNQGNRVGFNKLSIDAWSE